MRRITLLILVAGALAAVPVLAQQTSERDAGPRQFGSVVGVPNIWPSATDAGTAKPDAG